MTEIDSTVPQTARVWNYWLGGRDNYAVDRAQPSHNLAGVARKPIATS